jgi:hypothetical protein
MRSPPRKRRTALLAGYPALHHYPAWARSEFSLRAGSWLSPTCRSAGAKQTGRFKVFDHLSDYLEEFQLYRRKNCIVDERDDLMSATRYGHMMLRMARTKPQPAIRRPTNIGMIY